MAITARGTGGALGPIIPPRPAAAATTPIPPDPTPAPFYRHYAAGRRPAGAEIPHRPRGSRRRGIFPAARSLCSAR